MLLGSIGVSACAGTNQTPDRVIVTERPSLDRWCHHLARGIVTAIFAFAPDRVVLGTIAAAAGEQLCLAPLRALVAQRIWPGLADGLSIEAAALWPDGAALAGVAAALEGLAGRDQKTKASPGRPAPQ